MGLKRICSEQTLEFVIPGRPICRGYRKWKNGEGSVKNNVDAYTAVVTMIAKTALASQNWEYSDVDPVYIVITINLASPIGNASKATRELMWRGKILPTRYPTADRILKIIMYALEGIAYKGCKQVVGVSVVKRYGKKDAESVEVLIGKPKNWSELNNDLRNS